LRIPIQEHGLGYAAGVSNVTYLLHLWYTRAMQKPLNLATCKESSSITSQTP
jgi:hypothetical protein